MPGYPARMEGRRGWRACSMAGVLVAVSLISGLIGRSSAPQASIPTPAEMPRVREHILLRNTRRCSPNVQTMLRVVGATSDALWGRLLDVHPNPAAAVVVDVSVFKGGKCIDAALKGFKTVVCFESSPLNFEVTQAAARQQNVADKNLQLVNMAVLNVTGFEVEVLIGDGTEGRSISRMVPTTTLDDYLLPRLKLRRDDAFGAHMKDDVGHLREVGLQDGKEELYMVRVEVQGFEGLVVQGMQQLLRRKQVTYLMLNIWPNTMALDGRKSCAETLRMVADYGYTLHELALSPVVWDDSANRIVKEKVLAEAHDHPTDVDGFCNWVLGQGAERGLWVEVLAVHSPHFGGASCTADVARAQE